jgi:hypothetical protein
MSSMDNLVEQIQKTNEIIELCKANHEAVGLPNFISDLEISSLQQRVADLERQKIDEEQQGHEELEVVLYPQDLPSGQVLVRTLTIVLGGVQSLTDSVANTLFNQPSNRGPIPQEILERNSWILKAVKAGSFVAVLNLGHDGQMSFDETPQHQILSELFNLFNASDQEENLLDALSSLGPRTLRNYTEWTKNIRDLDTRVELSWNLLPGGNGKVTFDPERAERIYTVLSEKFSSTEEEVSFFGRLTGVNVRTSSFELFSNDGSKIAGRITKEKVSKAATLLDKRCIAQLLKVITVSSAGVEKISWTLKDITQREN